MDASPHKVKARRAYDGSRRQEGARRTRAALLDAALVRFLREGYEATTIESLAVDAGVSDATIYKTFGGKPGLVRALCERALAGEGSVPAEQRSDTLRETAPDPASGDRGMGSAHCRGFATGRADSPAAPRRGKRRPGRG